MNIPSFFLSLSLLVLPFVSAFAQENIEIKKTSLAGICNSLAEQKIYECVVNVGESVDFMPISPGCPVKFQMKLQTKKDDRSFYVLDKRSGFSGRQGDIERSIQSLFTVDLNKRNSIYSTLSSLCAKSQGASTGKASEGKR